jgi:hypothetical protein
MYDDITHNDYSILFPKWFQRGNLYVMPKHSTLLFPNVEHARHCWRQLSERYYDEFAVYGFDHVPSVEKIAAAWSKWTKDLENYKSCDESRSAIVSYIEINQPFMVLELGNHRFTDKIYKNSAVFKVLHGDRIGYVLFGPGILRNFKNFVKQL